jgi:hypothetical protein
MSRKDVLLPYTDPLMSNASMASNITGTPINIQFMDDIGIAFTWTGSNPQGSVSLQVSLDYNPNTQTGNWFTVQTSPGTNYSVSCGGAPGGTFADFALTGARWLRTTYTTTGGSSGNLTAVIGAKMV